MSQLLCRSTVGVTERLLLTVGLGFGSTFLMTILLGLLWEVTFLSVFLTHVVLLFSLGTVAAVRGLKFSRAAEKNHQTIEQTALQVFLVSIVGALVLFAVYKVISLPATDWDSLAYGVNYAKIIFENGNIPLIAGPSIGIEMSAPYPPGVQVTAASLYALSGNANDFYYKILSPIFSVATLIAVYKFALHLNKNKTFSLYAVSVLTLIPFFWELFIQETYIMALTFMLTMAAYFFIKAYSSSIEDKRRNEILGVLFCSFAALTSYIGLLAIGILLLYVAQKRLTPIYTAKLIAAWFVVVAPWYLRNLILLGNPVYPFLGIGYYLDPLLSGSTTQHFQQYSSIALYEWITILCMAGIGILLAGIAFFTFTKNKQLRFALPLYLLLIGVAIMAFHVAFPRYLIVALPILAVIFSTVFNAVSKSKKTLRITAAIMVLVVVLTSAAMLPYINTIRPQSLEGEDKWGYLSRIYEEADAWQWINQHTPGNARIATFDIKDYYLNRSVFPLDGNESAPLYKMSTIEEAIGYLQDHGVTHVLSVPWASIADNRVPPAYKWCPLTKYLGNLDYLPPVFVGVNGTTIYQVGALDEETTKAAFAQSNMIAPIKHQTFNLNVNNDTDPIMGKCFIPLPVDYRNGLITVSVNSSKPVDLELWYGVAHTDKIVTTDDLYMVAKSEYSNDTSVGPFTMEGNITRAGYFTLRVIDKENSFQHAFNATVTLTFYTFWDLE